MAGNSHDHGGVVPELDEAARPAPPRFDIGEAARAGSRHLRAIHEHHRRQLAALKQLFARFEAGMASAGDLADKANGLTMTGNLQRFGTLCGQECQALVFHHQIEDGAMYPQLQRSSELNAVIAQLMKEHEVVHAQVVSLWDTVRALVEDPKNRAKRQSCGKAIERLERTVLSHFGYEEDSLLDAIDHYGVAI